MTPYPDYPIPESEEARLRALERTLLLDTPSDPHLDRITALARTTLAMPIALISLVDRDRQWFLSKQGLSACETPRGMAFCAHAITADAVMVVPDARADERFRSNPLVIDEPYIRFYAGAPLKSQEGENLGTLCVIDQQPHAFTSEQTTILTMLSELVSREIEFRGIQAHCSVTGLWSRKAFLALCEKEFRRAQRIGSRLHLLLFEHRPPGTGRRGGGARAAEEEIRELASGWQSLCTPADMMGRMADRIFALLLVDTTSEGAKAVARSVSGMEEQINRERTFPREIGSIQIGMTAQSREDLSSAEMILRAENALFLASEQDADPIIQLPDESTVEGENRRRNVEEAN